MKTFRLLLPTLALASTVCFGQDNLTLDEITRALQLTDNEMRALENGEFVHRSSEETSDKELATTIALILSQSFEVIAGYVDNEMLLRADGDLIAFGKIDDRDPTIQDFEDAVFTPRESAEIRKLANITAGDTFNLSTQEIANFQVLKGQHSGNCHKDPACFDAFNGLWKQTLLDRMRAYRAEGLAGIADYDRGGDWARPAEELRNSLDAMWILKRELPQVHRALMDYPTASLAGIEHSFFWKKVTVRDRPTFALSHRILYRTDDGLLAFEREFYVQQAYNSLQRAGAAFPFDDERTICFHNHRTSTDQVTGFGSGTRRSIGRKMMVSEIKRNLEELRSRAGQ